MKGQFSHKLIIFKETNAKLPIENLNIQKGRSLAFSFSSPSAIDFVKTYVFGIFPNKLYKICH